MGARNRHAATALAATVGLALCTAACSSGPPSAATADTSPSFGQKLENLVLLGTTNPSPAPPREFKADVDCPTVDLQPGTAAYQLYVPGHQGDAYQLRYQARFGQFARECDVSGNQVTIRIGVSGRLVVGPKGNGGTTLTLPVRVALLNVHDRPVFSKLTPVAVSLAAGQGGADFREVVTVPAMPVPKDRLYGWYIRVGFDTGAATAPAKHRRRHARR
jgi:hypothetical protein